MERAREDVETMIGRLLPEELDLLAIPEPIVQDVALDLALDDEPRTVSAYVEPPMPEMLESQALVMVKPAIRAVPSSPISTESEVPVVDLFAETACLPSAEPLAKKPGFLPSIKRPVVERDTAPRIPRHIEVTPQRYIATQLGRASASAKPPVRRTARPRSTSPVRSWGSGPARPSREHVHVDCARNRSWISSDMASFALCLMLCAVVTFAFFTQLV
jgi:hypothetical protein